MTWCIVRLLKRFLWRPLQPTQNGFLCVLYAPQWYDKYLQKQNSRKKERKSKNRCEFYCAHALTIHISTVKRFDRLHALVEHWTVAHRAASTFRLFLLASLSVLMATTFYLALHWCTVYILRWPNTRWFV